MKDKNFASLGSSLLARKGGAKPAMRRASGSDQLPLGPAPAWDDLGWNDIGEEHPEEDKVVQQPVVHQQHAEIAARLGIKSETSANGPSHAKPRRSALAQGKRAAFTLRLDAERHFKLHSAATMRKESAQAIVTKALDKFLANMPEINHFSLQSQHPETEDRKTNHG